MSSASTLRVRDLSIQHLDYVFSPPGLPLVKKTPNGAPSTAVLIRGPAGAGKSSVATGVAHAIAKAGHGVAVYISTEAFPAEIRYKAELFQIDTSLVRNWDERQETTVGGLLVRHLALVAGELAEDPGTTETRSDLALQAVLKIVEDWDAPLPIRAVVIDAMALPESTGNELSRLRTAVLTTTQALEARGVTPILVEETGTGGSDALTFVVDLVLDVRFDIGDDGGALLRKLRIPKSRFATAAPGPHDMGIEHGRPAVWPDLLDQSLVELCARFEPSKSPRAFFIVPNSTTMVVLGAELVTMPPDWRAQVEAQLAISSAHIKSITLRLGPSMIVDDAIMDERLGLAALAWVLLDRARKQGANTILVDGPIGWLLSRPRTHVLLPRFFDTLRASGLLTIVFAEQNELGTLARLFDINGGRLAGPKLRNLEAQPIPRTAFMSKLESLAERLALPEPRGLRELPDADRELYNKAWDAIVSQRPPNLPSTRDVGFVLQYWPANHFSHSQLWAALVEVGKVNLPLTQVTDGRRIWLELMFGRDAEAARLWWPLATGSGPRDIWWRFAGLAFLAIYANDTQAIEMLIDEQQKRDDGLILPVLVRALGRNQRWEQAKTLVEDLMNRWGWSPEQGSWRMALIELEAGTLQGAMRALPRLEALSQTEGGKAWAATRAYAEGLAHTQLGDRVRARELWRAALDQNPHLDLASEQLSR